MTMSQPIRRRQLKTKAPTYPRNQMVLDSNMQPLGIKTYKDKRSARATASVANAEGEFQPASPILDNPLPLEPQSFDFRYPSDYHNDNIQPVLPVGCMMSNRSVAEWSAPMEQPVFPDTCWMSGFIPMPTPSQQVYFPDLSDVDIWNQLSSLEARVSSPSIQLDKKSGTEGRLHAEQQKIAASMLECLVELKALLAEKRHLPDKEIQSAHNTTFREERIKMVLSQYRVYSQKPDPSVNLCRLLSVAFLPCSFIMSAFDLTFSFHGGAIEIPAPLFSVLVMAVTITLGISIWYVCECWSWLGQTRTAINDIEETIIASRTLRRTSEQCGQGNARR